MIVLVWLWYTKIWTKSKNILYGYRQLYSVYKTRRHLHRHSKDVERRLDTLNDELGRSLLQWKSKKLIRLMKYELEAK